MGRDEVRDRGDGGRPRRFGGGLTPVVPGRVSAEWISFGVASTLIAILAGVLGWEMVVNTPPDPPAFRVEIESPRTERRTYYVDVTVENVGDAAAENVQVMAELSMGESVVAESDQVIDILSGGASTDLTFVFESDPGAGELVVRVTGHEVP